MDILELKSTLRHLRASLVSFCGVVAVTLRPEKNRPLYGLLKRFFDGGEEKKMFGGRGSCRNIR